MERAAYQQMLDGETEFHLWRAVERLRSGLFDPVAVRLLTAHEKELNRAIDGGFRAIEEGKTPHLCICGAYGQGKSHSLTYIQDRALREGFVTSFINLDPREVPFHNFGQVYRALMANLRFPGTEVSLAMQWKAWAERQMKERNDLPNGPVDLLPEEMPHMFRSVLVAIAQNTVSLSERQKKWKEHAKFRPGEYPYLLARALAGDIVPTDRLQHALKYRQVSFYMKKSLVCQDVEVYLQMVRELARLFRKMGYRGWVLLFDEGESITQASVQLRSRSYPILHRMFVPDTPGYGLYPIFAFTDDFFQRVQNEDYERVWMKNGVEIPYFGRNYADAWRDLAVYRLQDLSRGEWNELIEKLICLHVKTYRWQPSEDRVHEEMTRRLAELDGMETRFRLKALVDHLDIAHQEDVLQMSEGIPKIPYNTL